MMAHRIWHLGDNISTDDLARGHAMKHGLDVLAKHCLETVDPDFAANVKPGDVIVAGKNFGIGSSREQAAQVLVALGVKAVIAENFNGLFFRNGFNVGLLLLTCPTRAACKNATQLVIHLRERRIESIETGRATGSIAIDPVPEFLLEMVEAGGLLNQLKRDRLGQRRV